MTGNENPEKQQSVVEEQLNQLEFAASELQSAVNAISARLNPVLPPPLPTGPCAGKDQLQASVCPVAEKIRTSFRSVNDCVCLLRALIKELQI